MKRLFFIALLLLLLVIAAVFAARNAAMVEFDYYLGATALPLALLLFLGFLFGALFGVIFSVAMVLAGYSERRRLKKQLALCQQEIRNLREIPIKGPY